MKAFVLAAALTVLFAAEGVMALSAPGVTTIPPQLSAGSSFIALADGGGNESVRIMWRVQGLESVYFGSFPRSGDMFTCYFSDSDPEATCGPTPFKFSTSGVDPYTMLVDSVNRFGETSNATVLVDVGGIDLASDVTVVNNTVSMIVYPSGAIPTTVSYAAYHRGNVSLVTSGYQPLKRDPFTGYWLGNVTLPGGEYFMALSANSGEDFGGELLRISIPLSPGEGGTCKACPGETGEYPLESERVKLSGVIISPGQEYEQTGFRITNTGNETFEELSAKAPAGFEDILNVYLDDDTLGPADSTLFTVSLSGIRSSMTINALVDVLSVGEVVGQVAVEIPVTVIGGGSGVSGFSLTPDTWVGDYLVSQGATKSFAIANSGAALKGIGYSFGGGLKGIASATAPSSLEASGTGSVEVFLNPDFSGNYQGTVTLETDSGDKSIVVSVNFFEDISADLEELKSDFEDLKTSMGPEQVLLFGDALDGVDSAISDAENELDFGNYGAAEEYFGEAEAKISVLGSLSSYSPPSPRTSSSGGADFTGVFVIFAVIVIAVAAVFLLKKRGSKKSESIDNDLEKELEETLT